MSVKRIGFDSVYWQTRLIIPLILMLTAEQERNKKETEKQASFAFIFDSSSR